MVSAANKFLATLVKLRLIAALTSLLFLGRVASAHRLDEYLQATIFSLEKDRVDASLRLIPGVAVAPSVIAAIDRNGDGVFSEQEEKFYAASVLQDLALSIDGQALTPTLLSCSFPTADQMRQGLGEIHIEYTASLPPGAPNRSLTLRQLHPIKNSAYLVNASVPDDPDLRIVGQRRNEQQSFYELDFSQADAGNQKAPWWTTARAALNTPALASLFRLGMRHIAEGTDHLLFLLALLLPAPAPLRGSRWQGAAGVKPSLLRILRIVTAFTIGHSLTLALAAWHVISVPSRPIEILIAVSILVSAIHAIRPIFPGKEAWIALFFGLIHGLAFATTLSNLGLGRWERFFGILAFNSGIETMQLLVVALTMPSLLLLSRTRAYPYLRVTGALFAACASLGWIVERVSGTNLSVDKVVGVFASHGLGLALGLFAVSMACFVLEKYQDQRTSHSLES